MADAKDALLQKEEQSLDFFSAKFDALKALYTKELRPPIPNIQVFNNLGEYARVIKEGKTKTASQELPTKKAFRETNKRTRNLKPEFKPPDIGTRLKAIAATEIAQEDLLSGEKRAGISDVVSEGLSKEKDQSALGLGRAGRPWKKKYMNVLEKMDACSSGPLSILYKCLEKRYKVQVWIRKYKGLRSVLTGYVIAFDKHLNLALMDVDEVYTTEEYHIREHSAEEDKATRKKKKKKKRKKKNHLKQNGGNLMDTSDKGENILLACENVYEKSSTDALSSHLNAVSEVKENSAPLTTSSQDPQTGLISVNDLNKPYNLFNLDNKMRQSKFFNNNGETTKMTSIKDSKNSSPLVRTRKVGEAEMLSAEQLASIKRQWTAETDQEKNEMPDFQQQIQSTDSMEPTNLESEHTSYLFSHDLTVRVPACDDSDSRDMEFIVVGIFQPASTAESNQDDSVTLPEGLEINVPISFSNSIDKNEDITVNQIVQPENLVVPFTEPDLHSLDADEASKDKVVQPDNPVVPFTEPDLHSLDADEASKDKVIQPDNPVIPVSEPVLHSMDTDEESKDKVIQPDNPVIPVSEPVLHSIDTDEESKGQVLQLENPVIPDLEPVLQSTAQPVESFTTETCIIDEKPLMKYREKRLLQCCDFSNDKSTGIPDQPSEPNTAASCIIEEEVENENSEEEEAHNVSLDKEQNKSMHSHVGQYKDEFNRMEGKNVKEMEERYNGNESINHEGVESFGNKDQDRENPGDISVTVPEDQGTKGKVLSIIEPGDLYSSQKHEADGLQERYEESSGCGSVLSVNKEDATAELGSQQKELEENSNTGPKQEETNGRNGKDEREEIEKVQPRKETKGGGGDVSYGDECEKKKEKDEDKAMESEKEEGEITSSSDDEQPFQNLKPLPVQSKHDEARNDTTVKTKKLSVWDRLGFSKEIKKERATSRHGSEKHEKERRKDRNQASRRNENDEKKLKDRGRRSTRDGERKQETVSSKETNKDEGRDNTKTGDRRRSVGSEKELRKGREDKDVGMKRKQGLIGRDERRGSAESDAQPNLDRRVSGTKREQRLSSHDKRRGSAESDAQLKENLDRRVSDTKREQRVGSRGSNEGEKKPSRGSVGSNDQPRKNEKGKTDGVRRGKEPSSRGVKEERDKKERLPSRIVAREMAEQCLASSRREMNPKKQKGEGMEKEQKLSGCEAKQTERREDKGSSGSGKEPRINKEDKNGARNSRTTRQERKKEDKAERTVQSQCGKDGKESSKTTTRHGTHTRRENIKSKEKKGKEERKIEETQSTQPTSDSKKLILREVSSNQNETKLTKKERQESSDILKSVQGAHPKKDPKEMIPLKQKKHEQPKLEESERSERNRPKPKVQEQAQATQLKERHEKDKARKHKHSKDSRPEKPQETQSKESSGENTSKRESKGKKSCEESGLEKPLENPRTVETNDKQVKPGLLPTPVLNIRTNATSRTGLAAEGAKDRPGFGKSVNESVKSNKTGAKVQKSSETIKKRKLSLENGREGRTKRQKRTEITEKNKGTLSSSLEQNKDTSVIRKKDTSDSASEVKARRQTTENDSMSMKKDMGGVGENPVCTARRIEVGKGKYLEFRRRHVNQLFVRGDNVVMVAYAT